MSSKGSVSSTTNRNKRKHNSPSDNHSKTTRRRFLSASLPDLNSATSETNIFTDSKEMETNPSTATGLGTGPGIETLTLGTEIPTSDSHPPLIQTEGQTYSLPTLIYTALCDKDFMTKLVPMLANAITPTIERAVQTVFQQMTDTIKSQTEEIQTLKKQLHDASESNADLQNQIWGLEESLDDLEQYGRRNSLRFHNCSVPPDQQQTGKRLDTDSIVVNICKKMGVELTDDDISRSHPIGKPNSRGNIQIISKFKNWKVKNKVYSEKRKLKNSSVFVTEDLTKFRQGLVQELSKAKRDGYVNSFWTNDSRIFAKVHERGPKSLIRSFNDINALRTD